MVSVRTGRKVVLAVLCLLLLGYVCIYIYITRVTYVPQVMRQKWELSLLSFTPHQEFKFSKSHNESVSGEKVPLLTLFTTWSEGGNKTKVWNNTLRNWANFKHLVRPVFFYTNERQAKDIARHGWDVLPVRETAASGLPILKYMFLAGVKRFNSLFYGYSNGDIIFDDGLINTLRGVVNSYLPTKKPVLITGIRTNVANLTEKETGDFESLASVAKKRGSLFVPSAEDYFITDASYPWADIPELVIGRIAYDNWLVLNARQKGHTVIDATETLTAVHQTTQAGNFEGWQSADKNYNLELLDRLYGSISYYIGSTVCAPWVTARDGKSNIIVIQRTMIDAKCFPLFS